MTAICLSMFVLAAPAKTSPYVEDVAFALDAIEKQCGHFFKIKGIAWDKVRPEFLAAAKKVKTHQEHFMLLNRLVARIEDGHARVDPTEATKGVAWPDKGPQKGPGLFWCTYGLNIFIKNVWGAAERAGVRPGMQVLSVDGVPADKWLAKTIDELRDLQGFSTDNQALFFTCHWGLAGPQGSQMRLRLKDVKGATKQISIPRLESNVVPWGPAVFPKDLQRIGRQSYGKLASGFGYIHLRDVPGELPAQLDTMLAAIGDVPGLILDCRANGGGGCDHDAVFGRFVPKGRTLAFAKGYASQGENPYAGPMVVIVDAGCRSAGETVSGMFKEDGRAYMIGPSPTAGMSSSKTTIELPSKLFSLYVSVRSNKGRFNGGQGIEGIGVPPHEVVSYDPKELVEGIDTLIRKAEDLLRKFPSEKVPYKPEQYDWKAK